MNGTNGVATMIISQMQKRTARRRAPNHLEQVAAQHVPVEQEEFLEPRCVVVLWGSAIKRSLGATRKPR